MKRGETSRLPVVLAPGGWSAAHERAFLPAALEIVETPASPTLRWTALGICAVFAAGIAWASIGRVDTIAVAPGKIIATDRTQIVQPDAVGTVRAILVRDGERVLAGQTLITLDPTAERAGQERAARDLSRARLDIARLSVLLGRSAPGADPFAAVADADLGDVAAARSRTLAMAAEQQARLAGLDGVLRQRQAERQGVLAGIARIESELPLAAAQTEIRRQGMQTGYGSRLVYLETQQRELELRNALPVERQHLAQAESAVGSAEDELARARSDFSARLLDELSRAEAAAGAAREALTRATERLAHQTLVAPVTGIVQGLDVHTVGAVVTPAEHLLSVVPSEGGLQVEAVIDNHDIGFVAPGDPAEIKVDTFPFTRYGVLHGTVSRVALDAVPADPRDPSSSGAAAPGADATRAIRSAGTLAYAAQVTLDRTRMAVDGRQVDLLPGMAVSVEIKTGRRRVIDYLLSPLSEYLHDSLHER